MLRCSECGDTTPFSHQSKDVETHLGNDKKHLIAGGRWTLPTKTHVRCIGCNIIIPKSRVDHVVEHFSKGDIHQIANDSDSEVPPLYDKLRCNRYHCGEPIKPEDIITFDDLGKVIKDDKGKPIPKSPDKITVDDKEKAIIEGIVRHLKTNFRHRDKTLKYYLPILIGAIMALFLGLIIHITNIGNFSNTPNVVGMNWIITGFVLVSAGISLYTVLKENENLASGESHIGAGKKEKDRRYNKRLVDGFVFAALIVGTIVYAVITIPSPVNIPLGNEVNIMVSAAMLASAGYLLLFYRYHRGGRSIHWEIKAALSEDKVLMSKVWNYGFSTLPSTSENGDKKAKDTPQENRVFSTIYGILAGLAITVGLQTYYNNFINPYILGTLNPPLANLMPYLQLLPLFRLLDFFLIVIPLAHAGYIFLLRLTSKSVKSREYSTKAPGLTAVFLIFVVQVAILFFLGGSIAYNCPSDSNSNSSSANNITPNNIGNNPQVTNTQDDICEQSRATESPILWSQTRWFVIWLLVSSVIAGLGILFIKGIIERNRIPIEWASLHVITIGFIILAYLPVSYLPVFQSQEDEDKFKELILQFNIVLMGILIGRAALDYIIGLKIYFPDIPPEET